MNNNRNEKFRSGIVTIIGRPNVGKSTLLNCILKQKVAIVSDVPQTTRHELRGIYNDERGQIVFIDTPGLHRAKDGLGQRMNIASQGSMDGADCIIHVVDSSEQTGPEEEAVINHLKGIKAPVIVGLNKIDLKGKYVAEYIELWEKIKGKPVQEMPSLTLLPLSGKTGFNTEKLIDIIFENLPEGPALYPKEIKYDLPQRIAIADIIREKLFWAMRDELPHALAVMIEEMTQKKGKVNYIRAIILVERESQKEIVIGKGGEVLKKAGTLARGELETLLNGKVFLELFVRTEKKWRDNDSILGELGF